MDNGEEKVCHSCGKPATCFGSYEGIEGYACDECCGHGNEDGHCAPLDPDLQELLKNDSLGG